MKSGERWIKKNRRKQVKDDKFVFVNIYAWNIKLIITVNYVFMFYGI